jgi:uncharacterized protein (TIGR02118 family)
MIKVTVMWPNSEAAAFNHDYYLQSHIPMAVELFGDRLKKVEVDRGIAGLGPGSPPPYVAITQFRFESLEDFQAAFGRHGAQISGDQPNFSAIDPVVQISEVAR